MPPEAAGQDILFSQNCLQCAFENKDLLQPDELDEAIDGLVSAMMPEPEDTVEVMSEVFDMIMSFSDHELKQLTGEMIMEMLELEEAGLIPPEVELKLRRALLK